MSHTSMDMLKKNVEAQGNVVRQLKEAKADKAKLEAEVNKLKRLKDELAVEEKKIADSPEALAQKREAERREKFDSLLKRKFFVVPAFDIYGGVAGLYDFGPPGSALMQNIISYWRQHFVLAEDMLEVSCTSMTPEIVLKTSGHVEKFTDFMVKDEVTGDFFRADKLVEAVMKSFQEKLPANDPKREEYEKVKAAAGAMQQAELAAVLAKYDVKSPDTGNKLTAPYPFNLMFVTQIGPSGKATGYLRPETAQGIFVNFRNLLEFNNGRMPFAAAQIGPAFRNEIAPRAGLLRVREFTLAEIEHFVDGNNKDHPKFKNVADQKVQLLSQSGQEDGNQRIDVMTLGEAVARKVVSSETMGYFLGRTYLFLTRCGIKPAKLRFRQHRKDEMAHYAKDCWDAEIFIGTHEWVECVGHADRSAYDLESHSKASKVNLSARETFKEAQTIEVIRVDWNFKLGAAKYKKDFGALQALVKDLPKDEVLALEAKLASKPVVKNCDGLTFELEAGVFKVDRRMEKVHQREYIPNVIEPSYGLGRILYAILEHSFDDTAYENDDNRMVLRLPALIAPTKVGILPFKTDNVYGPLAEQVSHACVDLNLTNRIDESGITIGRKYARADEIGIPFCVTLDEDTLKDRSVTIRNRDDGTQIRVSMAQTPEIISSLCRNRMSWDEAYNKFPRFVFQRDPEDK